MSGYEERSAELRRQEDVWAERRQVSGHGALDADDRPVERPLIVMLAGPIKWWWGENWMGAEHRRYDAWRSRVCEELVRAGHLVYRPHEAFKGTWHESAQAINEIVVHVADVVVVLTPFGAESAGTDEETVLAAETGRAIVYAPPPDDGAEDEAVQRLLRDIAREGR